MSVVKISNELTFRVRTKSARLASEALTKYNEQDKDSINWLKEDNKIPIFFDTNVLLNIYDISEKERESFIRFLEKNKHRVYISSQVQREYLRHRVLQIRGVKSRITKIKSEIATAVSNLDKIIENKLGGIKGVAYKSVVKYGMPKTYDYLDKIITKLSDENLMRIFAEASTLATGLTNTLSEECQNFETITRLETEDSLLAAIAQLQFTEPLDENEKKYVIELYKTVKDIFDKETNVMTKETITFPGSGDKSKPVDAHEDESVAWGDLYIYCDMLRFMKENDTDVLFITRDVSKGDWLRRDSKLPFTHYIENSYEQTGHLMFIKESDRYLPLVTENNPVDNAICQIDEATGSTDDQTTPTTNSLTDSLMSASSNIEKETVVDDSKTSTIIPETYTIFKRYRQITREEFMSELTTCYNWATSYGAGYVNVNYFIYDILAQKKYDFESCHTVLEELRKEKKIELKKENHEEREIECISILD